MYEEFLVERLLLKWKEEGEDELRNQAVRLHEKLATVLKARAALMYNEFFRRVLHRHHSLFRKEWSQEHLRRWICKAKKLLKAAKTKSRTKEANTGFNMEMEQVFPNEDDDIWDNIFFLADDYAADDSAEAFSERFSLIKMKERREVKRERDRHREWCYWRIRNGYNRGHRRGRKPNKLSMWAKRSRMNTPDNKEAGEINN